MKHDKDSSLFERSPFCEVLRFMSVPIASRKFTHTQNIVHSTFGIQMSVQLFVMSMFQRTLTNECLNIGKLFNKALGSNLCVVFRVSEQN